MKLNIYRIIIFITFFCVFLSPTYILNTITGIDFTKYIFFIVTVFIYIYMILKEKISITEIVMTILIVLASLIQKSIETLSLLELLLIYRMIGKTEIVKEKVNKSNNVIIISVLGIIIYSIIYLGFNGRYIYTGIREINQSGFAIFMLALIIRKNNKKIGNLLLVLGLFTFSRNYLLCLIVFWGLELIKNKKIYEKLYEIFTFKKLLILSTIILILLSIVFEIAYSKDRLVEYKTGIEKYLYIFDYSNYFRFSTNTNLIKIYIDNPAKLLTGITEEEFFEHTYNIAVKEHKRYRKIKPHNYFFSYLRIYGLFSIVIFIFLDKIISNVVTKHNFSVLIIIFLYAIILGVGLANYWLYLSIFTLILYQDGGRKNGGYNDSYKNISEKKNVNEIIKVN